MTNAVQLAQYGAVQNSFKNRIINGGMVIDQRNAGASVTPTTSGYILDRYQAVLSQGSKLTFQQVNDTSSGAWFTFKATVAAQYSPTATEQFIIRQAIEGFNVNDLFFGGSLAKVITTSMQIKGSVAGTYSVSIANGNSDRSYVGTIAVTTSWTAVSITIIGDTSGTWFDDNRTGMYMAIDLGCGANLKAPTNNAWQAGDYKSATGSVVFVNQAVGSTLSFTNIQLEKGSVATSFDYRPYSTELSLCQRYYRSIALGFQGVTATSGSYGVNITGLEPMRALPTLTWINSQQLNGFPNSTGATFTTSTGIVYNKTASGATTNGSFIDQVSLSAEL